MTNELLLSLNIILPIAAALAALIRSHSLSKVTIIVISILLVINNGLILLNNDHAILILATFLGNYQLSLAVEPFAIIFALMVSILYCATNLYSFAYLDAQEKSNLGQDLHPKLHFFFTPLAIMASLNIGYSANLITLFVFYELLTLSTYPLVIQSFSENARKAGRYYLGILFGSSSFFLMIALIFIDYNYGPTSFNREGIFTEESDIKEILLLLICFVFGFSKTAIFPLHKWLPKAMVAPVPVSALLHAVAVVKSGIFALIKVFMFLFGIKNLSNIHQAFPWITDWLTLLACFTIIFSGIMACRQDNLKKILAYSTISQLNYMILALSFISEATLMASFLHMLTHSVAKISLFFATGIIYVGLHKVNVSDMRGIVRIFPLPVLLFIMAALSIIGLPFSVGGITTSKIYQAISCDNLIGSIAMSTLLISKILACYYFAKVIFQILSPGPAEYVCYHKPRYLSLVTAMTFSLSAILAYYLNDIELLLSK